MIAIQNQMGKEPSPLTAILVHQRCCQSPMGQSTVTPGPLPVLREYLMERELPASPGAEGAPPGLGELVRGAGERGCNWGGGCWGTGWLGSDGSPGSWSLPLGKAIQGHEEQPGASWGAWGYVGPAPVQLPGEGIGLRAELEKGSPGFGVGAG